MVIVIQDKATDKKYKIEPMSDGMSYRIFVNDDSSDKGRNGTKKKHEWQFSGYYPTDLEYAVDTVIRMCMLDDKEGTVVELPYKDTKTIKATVASIRKAVDKRVREILLETVKE